MALNISQLKEEYKEFLDEPKQQEERVYNRMRKNMEASFASIGIYLNEPGFDKTKSGQPRFFELGTDGTLKDALQDVPDIKSNEFLDKISTGRIFTFPTGQKHPVQIGTSSGYWTFSKPVKDSSFVKAPEEPQRVEKPSWWKRFANKITFGAAYRQDFDNYSRYQTEKAAYDKQMAFKGNIDRMNTERAEADIAAEKDRERAAEEKLMAEVPSKENYISDLDAKIEAMSNYYSPNPKREEAYTQKGSGEAPYTLDQFNKLKPIDIQGIKINGKQLTDDQFASLALCAAMQPQFCGNVQYDPDSEFSREESAIHHYTMISSDLGMIQDGDKKFKPRANVGQYFDVAIQPGREYAFEALKEYQNNKPEKLGALIAYGAQFQLHKTEHKTLDWTANMMCDVMVSRSMDLLDSDPKLLQAAKDAGLEPTEIESVKGAPVLAEVYRDNERAKTLLDLDSKALFSKGLSDQERTDCVKARLRYESVNESIMNHAQKVRSDPKLKEGFEMVEERFKAANELRESPRNQGETEEDYQKRRLEEQRRISKEVTSAMQAKNIFECTHSGVPTVYRAAGACGMEGVQQLSEALLPGQNKLLGIKGQELQSELDRMKLFSKNSPYAQQRKAEPETEIIRQRTVQKSVDKSADLSK